MPRLGIRILLIVGALAVVAGCEPVNDPSAGMSVPEAVAVALLGCHTLDW